MPTGSVTSRSTAADRRAPPIRRAAVAGALLVAGLTGCSGPFSDEPWTAPVESAGSITEWVEREPIGIGPGGGGVRSPDELLDALEEITLGTAPAGEPIVERRLLLDDAPPRAWVRVTPIGGRHDVRAYEVLVEMRETDGHRWVIDRLQERYHCVGAVATEFCE
ncbi:MAG TPA: hypothetical protein VLA76_08205 [Candidatus Angelobacter sp.]|nr:hypothetical protein [Candidatus Angelobacter sp.]